MIFEGWQMTLFRRFVFYFIGIGLGIIFVYLVVLRGRDWPAWLPQGVVIENVLDQPMQVLASGECAPENYGIDSLQLRQLIKRADVDFKASKVHEEPCKLYILNTVYQEKDFQLEVGVCDSTVHLNWIGPSGTILNCQ